MEWERLSAAVVLIIAGLGQWYLRILSRKSTIATTAAADKREDRKDINDEAWTLIRRLQEVIKTNAADTAARFVEIERLAEESVADCLDRERDLLRRCSRLERLYSSAIVYIRIVDARLATVKGWKIPPFVPDEDLSGSNTQVPIIPTP